MHSSVTCSAMEYPLSQIYFYLSRGCNLACRHCWISPRYQQQDQTPECLSSDLFHMIIEEAKPLGLFGVKLTGGEPLLHPHILELINHIRKEDLEITVETNGVLCTSEISRAIAECRNAFVSISLDGANAGTHEWVRGVKGCFDASISGLRNLAEAGLKPQVIITLMRINKEQMEEMVRLAESVGAGSVKFNVVQPIARGEQLHISGDALSVPELISRGSWAENVLSKSTSIKIFFDHPPAFRPLGRMFGQNGTGCGMCKILGILGVLADGSYALCGIGENIPEMVFGRAGQSKLQDIWMNSTVLNDLRQHLPGHLKGICAQCLMKTLCFGSCIAHNYYRSKELWAPFWFCDEADKLGLFPESRRIKTGTH